jgi:hypothetical protein
VIFGTPQFWQVGVVVDSMMYMTGEKALTSSKKEAKHEGEK